MNLVCEMGKHKKAVDAAWHITTAADASRMDLSSKGVLTCGPCVVKALELYTAEGKDAQLIVRAFQRKSEPSTHKGA